MNERGKKGFDYQAWAKNRVISASASKMDRGRGRGYSRPPMPHRGGPPRHRGGFPRAMHAGPSNSQDNNYYPEQLNGRVVPDIRGHLSQKRMMQEQNVSERSPDSWQRGYNEQGNFHPNNDNTGRVVPKQENNGGWYPDGRDGYGNADQPCHQNFVNSNHSNRGGYNQGMRGTNRRGERSFPANRPGRSHRGSPNNWRGRGVPRGSYSRGRNDRNFQSRNSQDEEYDNNDDQDYIDDLIQYVHDRRYEDDPHQAEYSKPPSHNDGDTRRSTSRASKSRPPSHDDKDARRSRSRASRSRQSSKNDKDARRSTSRASRSRPPSCDNRDTRRSRSRASRSRQPSHDARDARRSRSRASRLSRVDGGTRSSTRRSKSRASRSRLSSHDDKNARRSRSKATRRFSHEKGDTARPFSRSLDMKGRALEKDSNVDKPSIGHSDVGTENYTVKRSPSPDTDSPTQSSSAIKTSLDSHPSTSAINESTDSSAMQTSQTLQSPTVDISIAIESLAAATIINEHKFETNNSLPSLISNPAINVEIIDLTSTAIIENQLKTEISSPADNIEVIFESEKPRIGNDTCTNLHDVKLIDPPVSSDVVIDLSNIEENIENIPKTNSKLPVSHTNLIDLSEIEAVIKNELAMENEMSTDYSPASPDVENKGLAVPQTDFKSESSENSLPVSSDSASIDLKSSLEDENNGPNIITPISINSGDTTVEDTSSGSSNITPTIISSSDLLSKSVLTELADSTTGGRNGSAANVSVVSKKQNTASTPTSNIAIPEKENQKPNRKRSIDKIAATKANDDHSSATASREKHPDPGEEPPKKSTNHPAVPVNLQLKKPAILTKRIESIYVPATSLHLDKNLVNQNHASEGTAMMSEPSLPTAASLTQEVNEINEKNIADAISSALKATSQDQNLLNERSHVAEKDIGVDSVLNEAIEDMKGKKKRKSEFSEAKVGKKAKICLKINDTDGRKDNKQNIFKKNRTKQFKIILKIMQSRSNGWSLSQLDELKANNFCDAIHHFEELNEGICCLTEVKFFDNSVKANKINYKNLFGDEFNIVRYFGTFFKCEHTCFRHEYSKIIIYMNREIDEVLFRNNGINILYSNGQYTFDMGTSYEKSKIYKKCLEFFDLPKLAELLRDLVRSQKVFHFNMELMRKYHLALVNERVLRISKEKQNGKDILVAKFHPDFINYEETLSNAAKELHEHLEKYHCSPANNMKFRLGNKDFGKNVASARFEETVDNLPDEDCKKTFENFFKVFQIVRIDEKEMERVIDSELGEEFSKLEEESYINAAKEELLMSLKSNGLNPDVLEPIMQRISKLKLMKNIPAKINPQLDIEFEPGAYSSLEQAMRKKRTVLCLTENLSLSDAKMRLFVKNNGLDKNQASLFVTDEILFQMTDDVVKAFSHQSTNLIVILWKNHVVDVTRIEDVIKRLDDVIGKNSSSKNIIIIVEKSNINSSLSRLNFTKMNDDLTMKLRNDFSDSTIVHLHERKYTLIDLADDATISHLLGSTETREKLLTNRVKIESELLKPTGHKEKLFDFRLKQHVSIDSKIFQENINDIFLIRNISCEKFYRDYKPSGRIAYVSNSQLNSITPLKTRFILLDSDVDPADIFKSIKGDNIHLLSYESNNFIWKSTVGSPLALLQHKILDENAAVCTTSNVEDILINGPKTVLITGESGMGKSACLYDFAKQAGKLFHTNPVWPVQVILNENIIRERSIETCDEAIFFLADYLGLIDEQKKFFIMSAEGKLKLKLVLFIDGYDDVPDKNLINSLLKILQLSAIQKIFVASRTDKLENILGTFSYSLQFGDEERVQFMTKLCDGKGPKIDLTSKGKWLNTPLHLTMFTELCQKNPEKSSGDNFFDLYKGYVNLHLPDSQLKNAYELSARKLLTDNELREINSTIDDVDFKLPEQLSRQTIIEYFAAMWLSKKTGLSSKNCMNNLVERTSSLFLSVYLTAYRLGNAKSISVNKYAENGLLNFVKAVTKISSLKKPSLKRLLLNNKKNSYEMLTFLLEHYNDTGCDEFIQRDKYPKSHLVKYVNKPHDGKIPLEAAAEANRPDLACELMLKGADTAVLREQHPKFIESMAAYASTELANGNIRLGPIAAVLLKVSPQVTARLDNATQLPKMLAYLFSHGHVGLIEELLNVRSINDRCQLLETIVDGKSMLDHVNDSQLMKDDERRSMISYLATNSRSNLLQNNTDSILRSACLSGHENTFKYFISSNAKQMSIPILQKALRSNDERVIEFLMRDTKRTIDSDGNNALHQAVNLEVSRKTVNYLLGKVGINDRNNRGETALHMAFRRAANLSTIEFLLSAGASLDATDHLGIPPWVSILHYRHGVVDKESSRYSIAQQRELMTYLLQKHNVKFPKDTSTNYDFDLTRKEILPKLDYFANLDDYDLNYNDIGVPRLHGSLPNREEKGWCVFLINQGADVNIEKDGKSALHVALKYGCYEVAQLMLQRGAVVDKMDVNKNTPLDYLTSKPNNSPCHRRMKEVLYLAKKIFNDARQLEDLISVDSRSIDASNFRYLLNCRDVRKRTLLHVAALTGKASIIEKLHRLSSWWQICCADLVPIDVNAIDEDGNTPLHLAVSVNTQSVAKLLSIGARFRVKNSMGQRPMDLSCPGSSIRKLLQAAEDLFKWVEDGKIAEVKAILKKFPAVQYARDDSGKTPLHLAKDEKTMVFLLADANVLDEHRRSPIYYAAVENQLGRVKLLLKAGAIYDFEGFRDGNNDSFELLRMIDEMFEDMHSHQPKFFVDDNPWALDARLNEIGGKFGIARDVVVNVKDRRKNSLLHYAAKYDYVNVAENLLKNGAIFNCRNVHRKIPANFAFSSERLFKSVEDLFAKLDVDAWNDVDPDVVVNCRTSGGYTLLHKAVERGCYEAVEWLIEHGADVNATGNNSVEMRFDKDKYPRIAELLRKNR